MLRTLDRYIVREVLPPSAIALLIFTFTLALRAIKLLVEPLIEQGVGWAIVLRVASAVLPQALGVTIPMSLLVGLLVALGRMSADREYVAFQSCGISLFRLLRPVALLGVVFWAGSSYVTLVAAPAATRAFRELAFELFASGAESQMKPHVFIDRVRGRVLYFRDTVPGGWKDVFVADTSNPQQPAVYVARRGHLAIDRAVRRVSLVLDDGTRHVAPPDRPDVYELTRFSTLVVDLDWASIFPSATTTTDEREMTIAELRDRAAWLGQHGFSDAEPLMEIQQRFSIPVACFVLAMLGLALGASTANSGKLVSFVFGIAVIFVYYILMFTGRGLAIRGRVAPAAAMWAPDVLLGALAALLLVGRARGWDYPARLLAGAAGDGAEPSSASPARARWRRRRMGMLGLRTLDWYVARTYLKVFALAFLGLVCIFYVSLFTELANDLFRSAETARLLLPYYLFETPQIVYYVIPLATLVAALVTIGLMTKNSEIVVMKACGISLYRSAAPLLVLAALSTAALFGLQEQLLAESNRRADGVRRVIRGDPARSVESLERTWIMSRTGAIYHYAGLDAQRRLLRDLTIFEFDPVDWRLSRRTQAAVAVNHATPDASGYEWIASQGRVWSFPANGAPAFTRAFTRSSLWLEPIAYFRTARPEAARMSYRELDRYIADLRINGTNVTPYVVALRRKLSFPFVTIVMTLIAVPFAVTTGRRGALHGIGVGVGLAFGYWTTLSVFGALGQGGAIAPSLAAWAPNVLFGAGAVYLLLTTRT